MIALQINSPNRMLYTEVAEPELHENDVRIKIKSSAVCGSDLNNIRKPLNLPQIPGHECSGYVVELGDNASSNIKIGDMVTIFPMIGCMKCKHCKNKDYRECESKKSIGFDLPGTFSEEIVVNQHFVIPVKRDITYDQASLIEYLSCSYRLVMEVREYSASPDTPILIIGDGPVALSNVQMLTYFGYDNITVIGKHDIRLNFADNFGAKYTFKHDQLNSLNKLNKFKVCIYSVRADNTLFSVLDFLYANALLLLQARLMSNKLEFKLRSMQLTFGRAFAYYIGDFDSVINLVADGFINTSLIISNKVSLFRAAKILQDKHERKNHIKTIISI